MSLSDSRRSREIDRSAGVGTPQHFYGVLDLSRQGDSRAAPGTVALYMYFYYTRVSLLPDHLSYSIANTMLVSQIEMFGSSDAARVTVSKILGQLLWNPLYDA